MIVFIFVVCDPIFYFTCKGKRINRIETLLLILGFMNTKFSPLSIYTVCVIRANPWNPPQSESHTQDLM